MVLCYSGDVVCVLLHTCSCSTSLLWAEYQEEEWNAELAKPWIWYWYFWGHGRVLVRSLYFKSWFSLGTSFTCIVIGSNIYENENVSWQIKITMIMPQIMGIYSQVLLFLDFTFMKYYSHSCLSSCSFFFHLVFHLGYGLFLTPLCKVPKVLPVTAPGIQADIMWILGEHFNSDKSCSITCLQTIPSSSNMLSAQLYEISNEMLQFFIPFPRAYGTKTLLNTITHNLQCGATERCEICAMFWSMHTDTERKSIAGYRVIKLDLPEREKFCMEISYHRPQLRYRILDVKYCFKKSDSVLKLFPKLVPEVLICHSLQMKWGETVFNTLSWVFPRFTC